jgi:hypothetical protein
MTRIFFKTIPPSLNWLAFSALMVLFLKVFILNRIPEPISGLSKLGLVAEGVLGSIIASYMFYLIVVHLKEVTNKKVIYPHVVRWARLVVGDCKGQLSDVSKQAGFQLDLHNLSKDQIQEAFGLINPKSNAPLLISLNNHANWIQYFYHFKSRSQRYIYKIMSQLVFLEADFVAHLTSIEDCSHFSTIEVAAQFPFNNKDLSAFSKSFFEYCLACRDLDLYLESDSAQAYAA